MRWLADECVHGSLVAALRKAGHDVLYAAEDMQETEDIDLADFAMRQGRLVISEDRDFGRIVFRNEKAVPGIVYFRLDTRDRKIRWRRLKAVIEILGERLYGHFVVIDAERTRIRPLPDS